VTHGKENLTRAEMRREAIILDALRMSNDLCTNSFFKLIWLPNEKPGWLGIPPPARTQLPATPQTQRLNRSQRKAVQAITSMADANKFVLVQGPPGTGKTSVIACATQCLMEARHAIWLIAHSNVAVKNIAEKLAKEDMYDFKLLVSHEFHFDWCVNLHLVQKPITGN
jgi:regulator of nonsense transcripts 1